MKKSRHPGKNLKSCRILLSTQVARHMLRHTSLRDAYSQLASDEPPDLSAASLVVPTLLVLSDVLELVMAVRLQYKMQLDIKAGTQAVLLLLHDRTFCVALLTIACYCSLQPFVDSFTPLGRWLESMDCDRPGS